eukprot:CAMPEP_0170632230 /NCGR_PEP_ID=MMETSP0224-20130122/35202_1 /TAXON_ID=285029 /ORGANISM="Togula jolla, Strain CCCM 725" /LENGTH=35 /DNA_ID= /DNA_START= /DNA_END= /DNA_ORIENTATION=
MSSKPARPLEVTAEVLSLKAEVQRSVSSQSKMIKV